MYCIGLMSGTSVDGIDAALVEIAGEAETLTVKLVKGITVDYSPALRQVILEVCNGKTLSLEELADLDDQIAQAFAQGAILVHKDQPQAQLIGSHGQTVYHRPPQEKKLGYTLQLGRGDLIAQATGITTVSNFRVADIAAFGQGAPLVSKVDAYLLSHPQKHRCIQNLGGIGNVTYLPPREQENWEAEIIGWDTGPGNVLMDLAVQKLTQGRQTYDKNGDWARLGKPHLELVRRWLQEDFYHQAPPKSTGRELFSQEYFEKLEKEADNADLTPADWLATLTELTVASIVLNYQQFLHQIPDEVLLCGGGSHNSYLQERLQKALGERILVTTTEAVGLSVDFKEAIAFAVLAYWRYVCQFPGNLPQVTGAKQAMLLGDIYGVNLEAS
jgi:anhydro-N-acetylmuramic acid kinase